ncbi:MAG: hypothetical protein ABFS34_06345 [Gemmatimonadota bacterium]
MRKLMIAVVTAISLGALGLACDQRDTRADATDAAQVAAEVATRPDSGLTTLEDIAPGFGEKEEPDARGPAGDERTPRHEVTPDEPGLEIGDVPDWPVQKVSDEGADAASEAAAPPARPVPSRTAAERVNFTLDEIQARRAGTVAESGGVVPAGSVVPVRLDQQISTSSHRPGDAFTATTTQPLLNQAGRVVVPAGAVVRGRVTAVSGAAADGETSMLVLDFESISAAGTTYPLTATVVEARPERRKRTATRGTAAKIGAGAAAGAILGQVLGKDTESTLIGAAAGAAAGTAIALGTRDVEAVLPAGSPMAIRLDAPLRAAIR